MPTSISPKKEVIKRLGFFPSFLTPAIETPEILDNLCQQTLFAYINNPLPASFKEKLFINLSLYFQADYFVICHSCTLYSLGITAQEILKLKYLIVPETEADLKADLQILEGQVVDLNSWEHNSQLELSLLRCAMAIFLQPFQTETCSLKLRQVLGINLYNKLIVLLGYIKLCHQWLASHPEISYEQDLRAQLHLTSLLLEEIELAEFFQTGLRSSIIKTRAVGFTETERVITCNGERENHPQPENRALDREKLKTYFVNAPFPIAIYERNGQILHLNKSWIETTGYDVSEISTIEEWHQRARVKQQEIRRSRSACWETEAVLYQVINSLLSIPQNWQESEGEITESPVADLKSATRLAKEVEIVTGSPPTSGEVAPQALELKRSRLPRFSRILGFPFRDTREMTVSGERGNAFGTCLLTHSVVNIIRSEVSITTRNGERLFWEMYSAPLAVNIDGTELTIAIAKDVTSFIRSEAKLAKAEAKLKLILELTKTGSWDWQIADNQFNVCHRARAIVGLKRFNHSYESFIQSIHVSDRQTLGLAIAKAVQEGRDLELQYRIVKPDRTIRWIEIKGKLSCDPVGKPISMAGVVTDITDKIEDSGTPPLRDGACLGQRSLARSTFWDQSVAEVTSVQNALRPSVPRRDLSLWLCKTDVCPLRSGCHLNVVQNGVHKLPKSGETPRRHQDVAYKLRGKPTETATPQGNAPQDRPQQTTPLLENYVRRGGRPLTLDAGTDRCADKGLSPVRVASPKEILGSGSRSQGKDTSPEPSSGTRDVRAEPSSPHAPSACMSRCPAALERSSSTLPQHRQLDLAQSLDELRNLLNLIPYYLLVINVKTQQISICNQRLAHSFGFASPCQVQGKTLAECLSPENVRRISQQHERVLNSQEILRVQEKAILSDCSHYFDTVITPLYNSDGDIYALLHTFSDIPDLAAAQEALSQRTLQLEAANKELESFSYSVSHDLQAPLRVINGFSQILRENYNQGLDDGAKYYLQRIQANTERMSDLIDSLLQLSRITRSQMKFTTVNLSAIATEIARELKTTDTEREVELIVAPKLTAIGDPRLLRIVLNNLLDNAWKYTSKRSRAIIEFGAIAKENQKLTYFVRDNGAGFDLNYADKLFTAFKRLHTEAEFPGTGIGLATVQRIIYRHGGKVWARGECDRGATFYFSL